MSKPANNRLKNLIDKAKNSPLATRIRNFLQGVYLKNTGVSLYTYLVTLTKEWSRLDINANASAISFKFMMAFPPLLLFMFTMLPYLPLEGLEKNIYFLIDVIFRGSEQAVVLKNIVDDFINTPRTGLLSLSIFSAFFLASNGIYFTLVVFDKYLKTNVKETTDWKRRLKAFQLLIMFFVAFSFLLLIVIGQQKLINNLVHYLGWSDSVSTAAVYISTYLLLFLFLLTTLGLTYYFGPSVQQRWKFFSPGAIMATVAIIIFSIVLFFIANNFVNYNKVYGTIGSLFLAMIWLNTVTRLILVGFTLNISLDHHRYKSEDEEG